MEQHRDTMRHALGWAAVALSTAAGGMGLAWLVASAIPSTGRLTEAAYRLGAEDATVHTLRRS